MTQSQISSPQSPVPNPKLVIGLRRAQSSRHWSLVIGLLLLAWGLRLCCLDTVPPGWRDDELINIHALSGELLADRFPLYFTGASGHEPLYHYLHAGVHAILGFNVLSGHLLSVAFGTLTVVLTYVLARRLFGRSTAVVTSLALATSFWSLMYSRTAIRHINLPPLALAAFYLFWRSFADESPISNLRPRIRRFILLSLVVGASLYTYPAARLLPVLLVIFAAYLALFHRGRFSRHWRGLLLALAIMAVLAVPLGVVIAQGSADARLEELAVPLRELGAGDPRPLLESTWMTLGMFHATGDPEWLYNISGRPVFNLLGGALLWAGVALCLYRWRQPRYFFLLLWLGLGLLPAFVSTPPASLSHTILAQPVAYILPALLLAEAHRWLATRSTQHAIRNTFLLLFAVFLVTNVIRDLRDYFVIWPQQDMVRFLYRADYREAGHYLDAHPEITDVAISSTLMGPWDRLALEVDTHRNDIAVRFFNPERALVWVEEDITSTMLLTTFPSPAPPIDNFPEANVKSPEIISPHLTRYTLDPVPTCNPQPAICNPQSAICNLPFANGLELVEARWMNGEPPAPGRGAVLLTTWLVVTPLDLPPIPIVANPPPPGVYSGPRLAVFTHLLAADGTFVTGDDGLWVDPITLRPGDCFIQVHQLTPPANAPGDPYALELGLYDPMTGVRWPVLDSEGQSVGDRVLLTGEGEP